MDLDRGKRLARHLCSRESPALDPKLLRKTDRSCLSLPAVGTSSLQQAPMKHPWSHRCQAGGWRSLAGSRPCPGARTRLGPWLSARRAWRSTGACPWQPCVRPRVPCVSPGFCPQALFFECQLLSTARPAGRAALVHIQLHRCSCRVCPVLSRPPITLG